MIDQQVGPGRSTELQARGPAAHQGRHRCPSSCSGTTGRAVRDRRPLPAPRASRCTRARSRPGSSPATGTTPASTSCRAARSTSGPTTPAASTASPTATTCSSSRDADADPVGHLQARLRNGLEDDISLVVAKSVLGLLDAGVRAGRDRAHRRRVRHDATAARVGARASPCSSRWPTCSPSSTRDDRALALVHGLAFVARDTAQPRAALRRRAARDAERCPLDRLAAGTAASSTPARPTRPSARSRPRSPSPAHSADGRDDDVRGGHRPRLHRRRPHDRLHEQGVRGARPARQGAAGEILPDARAPDHRRAALGGVRRVAPPARPASRSCARTSTRSPPRCGSAAAPRRRSPTWARSPGSCSTTTPSPSPTRSSTRCARARPTRSSAGRSPTPPRCASSASTCRTTTATGTRCTTRSPPRTGCTRRCAAAVARAAARRGARGAAHLPRPLPQRARGPAARTPRTAASTRWPLLRRAGHGRRSRQRGVRLPHGGRRPRRARRRARPRAARRGRRVPLVPDCRGRRAPGAAWPEGSEEAALVLAGVARFLAAHTPTRRELPTVVRIATRLRRGEALYEDDEDRSAEARRSRLARAGP